MSLANSTSTNKTFSLTSNKDLLSSDQMNQVQASKTSNKSYWDKGKTLAALIFPTWSNRDQVRVNSDKINSSKEAVISFQATLVVNLSNRDSVPINNSLSNNNKKISSFSVTTVNSTTQMFKTHTRSILKISQLSDRHPKSSSPEKLLPKNHMKPVHLDPDKLMASKKLCMPLKSQLSMDLKK